MPNTKDMTKKVVTFGEIMLRLSTPGNQRFVQADRFVVNYGGAEANVAIALQQLGIPVSFITKVPNNPIGQAACKQLLQYEVDISGIKKEGERLGLYYLEEGASVRGSQVIYDRKYSAIADAVIADFDFESLFEEASWFHISGITPALSDNLAEISKFALQKAKEKGLETSLDLNYRKKLWTKKKAQNILTKLCAHVDVLLGEGVDAILGIQGDQPLLKDEKVYLPGYKEMFQKLHARFGFSFLASTLRQTISASHHRLGALLYDGKEFYQVPSHSFDIVDRVGGGDAFSAGIIYGLHQQKPLSYTGEFALALSLLKHTVPGDQSIATLSEVEKLMHHGGGSTRVQR